MNGHWKTLLIGIVLFLGSGLSTARGQDVTPQDEKFEDRVTRIYKNFNQTEVSDSDWSKIAGTKASENYTLQEGDTLWDISESFFGNGFYWPKVWQLNDKITNPHIIRSGNVLKFSSGSDVAPPTLDVEENGVHQNMSENSDDDGADIEEVAIQTEDHPEEVTKDRLIIPKGRSKREPLAKIPDSFPEWRDFGGTFDANGFAFDDLKDKTANQNHESYIPAVASETPWEGVGSIYEMEGETTRAATYQKVFVKLGPGVAKGDVFTVFGQGQNISDPDATGTVGRELFLKGTIKIDEPVGGEDNVYSAYVSRAISPVIVGDSLISGDQLVKADFASYGPTSNVAARVLELDNDDARFYNLHQTLFLNKGSKDGLQVGATLNVLKNYGLRNEDSDLTYDSDIAGVVKVVHVSDSVATAIVIKSADPIRPGDETGVSSPTGSPDSDAPSASPSDDLGL